MRSQTFRAWRATCFSEGGCEAATGDRELTPPAEELRLVVERTSAEAPGWHVAMEFLGAPPALNRALTVRFSDGSTIVLDPRTDTRPYRAAERFYVTDPAALATLLTAMMEEERVRVDYIDVAAEPRSYSLSLQGLTAAMLWIEEQLGALGTPRRAVPPRDLPEAEPLPASEGAARAGVPPPVVTTHLAQSGCEDPGTALMSQFEPVIEQLSETAILYAIPCLAGAYNVAYRLYVRETGEIGGVRTLYFATYDDTHNWSGTDLLFNIEVDGPRLTAFYKGRGLGDCGAAGEWTWVETGYRLDRYAAQDDCEGVPPERWPVVFPPG
ncbi:MAG TPA: DUF1176 domain-containing protein [Afifellaceae bacterium]|nr:DUF1176 domain-containing protein [Afifellaceae bacterium]